MRKLSKYSWFLILSAMMGIMGYLIISGNIRLYLSATLMTPVYIGFSLMILIWIYYLVSMFNANQAYPNTFKLYNAVFLIPIILFFTAAPTITTAGLLPNHNVTLTYDVLSDASQPAGGFSSNIPKPSSDMQERSVVRTLDFSTEEPSCLISDHLPPDHAEDAFNEMIGLSTDVLKDHNVTVIGFVYKDENYPTDTILLSRLKIACCIADASLVGYHVKVNNADMLEKGQWVAVTGRITAVPADLDGTAIQLPVITGGTVTPVNPLPLEDAYVYTDRLRIRF